MHASKFENVRYGLKLCGEIYRFYYSKKQYQHHTISNRKKKYKKYYAISAKLPSELLQLSSDSCHSNRLGFGNDASTSSFLFASVLQTISKLKTMPYGNSFYQMVFLLPQNISLALENGKSLKTPVCLIQTSSPIVLMLPV